MSSERGSASVVAAAVLGVAVVMGVTLAALAGMAADRAAARSGADLAALAAAVALRGTLDGEGESPCDAARRVAEANGVSLVACTPYEDGSVQVAVESGRATAEARAGPGARRGSG